MGDTLFMSDMNIIKRRLYDYTEYVYFSRSSFYLDSISVGMFDYLWILEEDNPNDCMYRVFCTESCGLCPVCKI